MQPYLIDSHCHLYLSEYENDIDDIIIRAEKQGVRKFYLPAIDSSELANLLRLSDQYPDKCFPMMGLHPCYVKENYQDEMDMVRQQLSQRKFAAIGEIGLDYYWSTEFKDQQEEVFHQQIELAMQHKMPVVIHSRNATPEAIDIISGHQDGTLKGIFHCFSGTMEEAGRIIDLGFLLGIGGVVTYKNAGLAELVKEISLDHIVLETDSPYLSPVPFRGKRNESSYLQYVVQKIADVKEVSVDEVATVTSRNSELLFMN